MANNVFANGREIACKKADGKSICAFPDVCFTPPDKVPPTPPGVPVPYPNTAFAKDTAKGSKKVRISGKEMMLKNKSHFKKSTGNEAGAAQKKGVVTSTNRGKVFFIMWSMDVKVEGENADRHLDSTTHNHASQGPNTPPWPFMDSMGLDADPCRTDRENESKACEGYKPNPEDGADACQEAGLSGRITRHAGTATKRSRAASAHDCVAARRCKLVSYDEEKDGEKGCCPAQTPDHVVPKSSFYEGAVSDGVLLSGWQKYNHRKAPCMCLEGANNTHGSHGVRHAHHKAFSEVEKGERQSFLKEAAHCAASAKAVAPQCDEGCLLAQIKEGHRASGRLNGKVKHSPSGATMSESDVDAQIESLGITIP